MEEFKEIGEDRGLYKKILKDGFELLKETNKNIIVSFKVILEDGTLIDEKLNFKFDMDEETNLLGLRIGIKTMRKGEKAIFVMRFDYGLGEILKNNEKNYSSVIACVDLINFS
jgi:hypothetical protein